MTARAIKLSVCLLFCISPVWAVETGPVIQGYGPVVAVPDQSYNLRSDRDYKVVFDVADSPQDPGVLNRRIESLARYLNMHARQGIDTKRIKMALVLHGSAGKDSLSAEAYMKRYQQGNPNKALMDALKANGVDIYLCGQTAGFRGYLPEELDETVTMAVSAMTVLTRLQNEGYALIP